MSGGAKVGVNAAGVGAEVGAEAKYTSKEEAAYNCAQRDAARPERPPVCQERLSIHHHRHPVC